MMELVPAALVFLRETERAIGHEGFVVMMELSLSLSRERQRET